jgi:hypothetical protein
MVTIRAMFQIKKNLKGKTTKQGAWELVALTCHDDAYESSFSITFFCSPSFPIHQSE